MVVRFAFGIWAVAIVVAACTTDYQKGLEDPAYGSPNVLAGQKQPGPTSEKKTEGTTTAGAPECVKAGGGLLDASTCSVSFKTDILGAFKAANCAASGCHGGASPANQPRIDPDDAPGMWSEFSAFKLSNGKFYINPCSTDPKLAGIGLNVNANAPSGDRGTLMPPGATGLPDTVPKIELWLQCGSPNN